MYKKFQLVLINKSFSRTFSPISILKTVLITSMFLLMKSIVASLSETLSFSLVFLLLSFNTFCFSFLAFLMIFCQNKQSVVFILKIICNYIAKKFVANLSHIVLLTNRIYYVT